MLILVLTVVGVVGFVAPGLPGAHQRGDVHLVTALGLLATGLFGLHLAVNLELGAWLEDAHVPALALTAHQQTLQPSVSREPDQGQVTARLIAARRSAALRVRHLRETTERRVVQIGQVQALVLLDGLVPLAAEDGTGVNQQRESEQLEAQHRIHKPGKSLESFAESQEQEEITSACGASLVAHIHLPERQVRSLWPHPPNGNGRQQLQSISSQNQNQD